MPKGNVVVGHREGGWIRLLSMDGYMKLSFGGLPLLKDRKVSYLKLSNGSCDDAGGFPITDPAACKAAAATLLASRRSLTLVAQRNGEEELIRDADADRRAGHRLKHVSASDTTAGEVCRVDNEGVLLSGDAARGSRNILCATKSYPGPTTAKVHKKARK